ncbi:MAG: NAD-dependent epimerase/dehydratase family protein [Myxococcales bacterium]|nr:NAD-dependent epimerase/dehydratase family protein [Myxococcales bacterium]
MRALVTGASGHVGANLCRELLAHGHQVAAFVRKTSDLRGLESLDVEYRHGDIRDAEALQQAVQGCDLVFHTAAVYDLGTRTTRAEEVTGPALEGTRNAIAAAAKAGVKRVVFTSSVMAVGNSRSPEVILAEKDWNQEQNTPYEVAKVESEREAYRLAEQHGIELVVTVPAGLLGPYDYRLTPSMGLLCDLINGDAVLGSGGAPWVDARDVARGHLQAASKGRAGERYILAGEGASNRDWMRELGEASGSSPRYLPLPRALAIPSVAMLNGFLHLLGRTPQLTTQWARAGAGRYWYYDSSKAERELGWTRRERRQMFLDCARWLAFTGRLKPKIAGPLLATHPPDPEWSRPSRAR